MNRRALLASVGATVAISSAGCSDAESAPSSDTGTATAGTETDIVRDDPLYVENFDATSYRLGLTITDDSTDESILEDRYEVPGERGLIIREIGREGHTYTVTTTVEDGPAGSYEWTVGDCEFEQVDDRALGVQIREGNLQFLTNGCDAVSVGHELDYYTHTGFVVDE